jgi:enamine deaminase RidA (YjgF/YER057c/UK114 family)
MDSGALFGHRREQVTYMSALDHLNPTHEYGVTFERATRLTFGDRSRYYVSGTASIDKNGQIVHPGDVGRQAERMLENIHALLSNYDSTMEDLKLAVVYLRDPADAAIVEEILSKRLPADLPRIMVNGAVCRPGWLVEMEGVAVNGKGDAAFAPFA